MKFKEIRNKRWFKIISNRYVIILLIFATWMLFIDSNSWLIHNELDQEISELETNKEYYRKEIARDRLIIDNLNDSLEIESFARQNYFMKRPNEDIFIIEFDTIKE